MAANNHQYILGNSGQRRNFSVTIAIAIAAMVAVSLLVASAGIYWATQASDEVSVDRQARSAQHAMEASVDELALQQETVAIWDDSAQHLAAPRLDYSWIHDNIGGWLNRIFGHDEVFILSGSDLPIYASVGGRRAPLERYARLAPDLNFLMSSVRGHDGGKNGQHDRNPRQPINADSSVRTTPRATHDSHLMLIGGRPAAASAMLMSPSTLGYVRPNGPWPVLVSIRYLDQGFLAELSSRQLISSPRFSRGAQRRAGEHVISLKTEWGDAIGYLLWKPELPGTRILWKLVPFNLPRVVHGFPRAAAAWGGQGAWDRRGGGRPSGVPRFAYGIAQSRFVPAPSRRAYQR